MATITQRPSIPPAPEYLPEAEVTERAYCPSCGCIVLPPPWRAVTTLPLKCDWPRPPVHATSLYLHERLCIECESIITCLWYYQGRNYTLYDGRPVLRGSQLDVYVWLVRESLWPDQFRRATAPALAADLGYPKSTISWALDTLVRRGYLEKMRHGRRVCYYRPLIYVVPKIYG
jgi:hypothetical protein